MGRVRPTARQRAFPIASLLLLAVAGDARTTALASEPAVTATSAVGHEPFVANQLVLALRPEPGVAALRAGPAASTDVRAERVAALRTRDGVARVRRAFRRLEDANGRLVRRSRDELRGRLLARGDAPGAALEAALARAPALENIFVIELEADFGVPQALAAFAAEPDVAWAEPNWIYAIGAEPLPALPFVPDDRHVTQDGVHWAQGALGQAFPDLYGLRNTLAIEAWNAFDLDGSGQFAAGETRPGTGVWVSVIDSGVDATHPDLADNVWINPCEIDGNGLDDDGNGFVDDVSGWDFVDDDPDPSDPNGHGTHVAGTIAALTDNAGVGIAGVAPWSRILPLRGLSEGGGGTATDLAAAIEYAASIGAHITSNSWGGPGSSQLLRAAFAAAEAAGLLNVTSAGNNDRDAISQSPANLSTVMAVAAVDAEDRRASFSNFGQIVEIAAPGVRVLSLSANAGDNRIARQLPGNTVGEHYLQISGTSMACPHVAGAAAVLMSAYPDDTPIEIRGRLMSGAAPIDAANPAHAGRLGAGRLDLRGALEAEPTPVLRLEEASAQSLVAGEQAEVRVWVRNFWAPTGNATASLASNDPNVRIDWGEVLLGAIGTGDEADNQSEPFLVTLDPATPFGEVPFSLSLRSDDGFATTFEFLLTTSFLSDATAEAGVVRSTLLPRFNRFQDYDDDGLPDILVADVLNQLLLYRNRADGGFRRGNRQAGLPTSFSTFASFFLDLDEDGDRDVLLGGRPQDPSRVFANPGSGRLTEVSSVSSLGAFGLNSAVALDYDADGRIDLLGGHGQGAGPKRDRGPLHLLQNRGGLVFEDKLAESGLPPDPFPFGLGAITTLDYDDDGDADVLFAAFEGGIGLWQNEGDGTFSDRTVAAFPDFQPASLAGVAVGDCDDDGDLDVFASGYPMTLQPPSRILRNRGGAFEDAGEAAGDVVAYNISSVAWGNAFFDLDNDGDLDLFVTKDVTYPGSSLPGIIGNAVFLNEGDCRFRLASERAFPRGIAPSAGAAAMADYDRDGDIDIYSPGSDVFSGPGALLRNEIGDDRHWLAIDLEGRESSRDAYGARVTIEVRGRQQLREVHTSPLDPSLVHFGLGSESRVDRLAVRWPSGIRQEYRDVDADRVFRIVEVDCGDGRELDGDGVCDVAPILLDLEPWRLFHFVLPRSPRPVSAALIGSADFVAADVDLASLAFGPAGSAPLDRVCGDAIGDGGDDGCLTTPFLEDVNRDGLPDLVVHFRPRDAGLSWRDTEICVEGGQQAGGAFRGCSVLRGASACGIGFELVLVLPPLLALRRRRRAAA